VYAGEFNEIVKLFNDEKDVRAAAHEALLRAAGKGLFTMAQETQFETPVGFRDFDDFFDRLVRVSYAERSMDDATLAEVKRRFAEHATTDGARFVRPMRVNVLKKAGP
jgi:hypothetical protein